MKKFKKIDEMRKDPELLGLNYGQHEKVLIDNKEYIATLNSQIYDDIIEDYVYNAIKEINKEFGIEMPTLKSSSFEDLISEACVDLRKKLFEDYANAGVNFINVYERSNGVLNIEGKKYAIIEHIEGDKYKVLAPDIIPNIPFDSNKLKRYKTSTIAAYLDEIYYNKLPEIIKNAIVETSILQKHITYFSDSRRGWSCLDPRIVKYDETQTRDAGTHKVFVPSWDEIVKVYGSTTEGIKKYTFDNHCVWCRDSYGFQNALYVNCYFHSLQDCNTWNTFISVRPAFVLDLSKLNLQKMNNFR